MVVVGRNRNGTSPRLVVQVSPGRSPASGIDQQDYRKGKKKSGEEEGSKGQKGEGETNWGRRGIYKLLSTDAESLSYFLSREN